MDSVRLNKYLADKGYATRRGADELIEAGKVYVNGRRAALGTKVTAQDIVEVKTGRKKASYRYFAFHKPRGVVTHGAQGSDTDIESLAKHTPELLGCFPVGRLDKDSSGLILLTDDGRVTDRLLNPRGEHEKEYAVRTKRPLRNNFKERMEAGVVIEGYRTKPTKVRVTGERTFAVTLTEGKRHQIRRMVVALFNEVEELKRIRVMNIKLGNLPSGAYRSIEGEELQTFLTSLGLN